MRALVEQLEDQSYGTAELQTTGKTKVAYCFGDDVLILAAADDQTPAFRNTVLNAGIP
jgi:hypothetical protein